MLRSIGSITLSLLQSANKLELYDFRLALCDLLLVFMPAAVNWILGSVRRNLKIRLAKAALSSSMHAGVSASSLAGQLDYDCVTRPGTLLYNPGGAGHCPT